MAVGYHGDSLVVKRVSDGNTHSTHNEESRSHAPHKHVSARSCNQDPFYLSLFIQTDMHRASL